MKYYAENLGSGTEFGAYFMNYHSKLPYISFFSAPTSCSHNANVKDTVTFFQACGNIPAVADAGAHQQLSNDSLGLIANQLLNNPLALANATATLNPPNLPTTQPPPHTL